MSTSVWTSLTAKDRALLERARQAELINGIPPPRYVKRKQTYFGREGLDLLDHQIMAAAAQQASQGVQPTLTTISRSIGKEIHSIRKRRARLARMGLLNYSIAPPRERVATCVDPEEVRARQAELREAKEIEMRNADLRYPPYLERATRYAGKLVRPVPRPFRMPTPAQMARILGRPGLGVSEVPDR